MVSKRLKKILCVFIAIIMFFSIKNLFKEYKDSKWVEKVLDESYLENEFSKEVLSENSSNYKFIDIKDGTEKMDIRLHDIFLVDNYLFIGIEYNADLVPADFYDYDRGKYLSTLKGGLFSVEPESIEVIYDDIELPIIYNGVNIPYNKNSFQVFRESEVLNDNFCKTKTVLGVRLPKKFGVDESINITFSDFVFKGNKTENEIIPKDNLTSNLNLKISDYEYTNEKYQEIGLTNILTTYGFESLDYKENDVFMELIVKLNPLVKAPSIEVISNNGILECFTSYEEEGDYIYLFKKSLENTNVVSLNIFPNTDKSLIIDVEK